ncbi:MAG: YqcI/YcgG family protein [Candidatus Eremiobacteraeota bacterium]|nr:YqcI/YcgG family protein [Candidatus Eremiobacteraeota bacterium]
MKMAHNALRGFIAGETFSCAGGKAALASDGYRFGYYPHLGDEDVSQGLARDLAAFVTEYPHMPQRYKSFIAIFGDGLMNEHAFEERLWTQLRMLHDLDRPHFEWDAHVSSDPKDPRFAFSFAGTAFFVVGMHPGSSRVSRRFAHPAMAFNPHGQFRELRSSGRFERVQRAVRSRELAVQNSLNPNLAAYGEVSEARQYSGRAVEAAWTCPFHQR